MKYLNPGLRRTLLHAVAGILLPVVAVLALPGCNSENEFREITKIEDLCHARVGVQIGTTTELAINEYLKKHECPLAERFNGSPDAVAALNQGKLDAVLSDELPARKFVDENPNLQLLDTPFQTESYAAILPKGQEDLLAKFDAIIDDLLKEGVYDKLYDTFVTGTGSFPLLSGASAT